MVRMKHNARTQRCKRRKAYRKALRFCTLGVSALAKRVHKRRGSFLAVDARCHSERRQAQRAGVKNFETLRMQRNPVQESLEDSSSLALLRMTRSLARAWFA